MNSFLAAFLFWLSLFILGWLIFPVTFLLFSFFKDRGYAFSKILSLAFLTYCVWILVSLNLTPYNKFSVFFSLATIFIISLLLGIKNIPKLRLFLQNYWKIILIEEIIFISLFLLGIGVRILNPPVLRHTLVSENFMNLAFINKLNASKHFPPQDPWMANLNLNYYYFGPLIASIFTKLLNISANSFLGLWNIGLFALGGIGAFGILFNVTKKVSWGLVGTLFLSLTSRLDLLASFLQRKPLLDYYFNNNRLDSFVVNEFPFYELVNHNPHSQVVSTIFILLALALILQLLKDAFVKYWKIIILGFILGIIIFTHAWDFPAILVISLIAMVLTTRRQLFPKLFLALAPSFFLFLPFLIHFYKPISRIVFPSSPLNISKIFLVFGFFFYPIILFIAHHFFSFKMRKSDPGKTLILLCVLLGLLLVIIPNIFYIKDCWGNPFNSFYKFYYQAWIFLALGAAGLSFTLWGQKKLKDWRVKEFVLFIPFIILFVLTLGVSIMAVYQRIEEGKGINRFDLDSFSYFKKWNKYEYSALEWIQKNTPPESIILENGLGDYWFFARVSALTGRSTILGWPFHEYCWRGNQEEINQRTQDIEIIFSSLNLKVVKSLLRKYNTEYIFIGSKEKEKYSPEQLEKFKQVGSIVFKNQEVTILKLNKNG